MGWRVWLLALGLALAIQALGFSLQWSAGPESYGAAGMGEEGIEIGLGQAGSYQDLLQQQTVTEAEPPVDDVIDEPVTEPVKEPAEVKPAPVVQEVAIAVKTSTPSTDVQYQVKEQQEQPEPKRPKDSIATDIKPDQPAASKPQPVKDSTTVADTAQSGRNQQQATSIGRDRSVGGKVGDARSYFAQLMAWLNQYKRYPSQAKKAKKQGVVQVLFTLNRSGDVIKRSIKKSSGSALLDQAALDMFDAASPLPPIPDFMERQQLSMVLPVDFSLITNNAFKE